MKVCIQAGAGTGKTTKVVELLLDGLLGTDTEPSRFLALTFTVRAANEMRDRLATWLGRLVRGEPIAELGGGIERFGNPAVARARAARALGEIDRIEIGTIHSFAAHLLRQYPIEAGVAPSFAEDDGAAEAALFRERWTPWLERRLTEAGEVERLVALLGRCETRDLREFAAILCHEGTPLDPRCDPGDAARWAARLGRAQKTVRDLLGRHRVAARQNEERAVEAVRVILDLLTASTVTEELRRRARVLEDAEWPSRKGWAEDKPAYAELRALGRTLRDCDDVGMQAMVTWLRPFVDAFRREYTRRGFVSFDGLLVRAAALLREHPDIRHVLKRRFRLILVDEFQDTDPLQGEILLYVAERGDRCEADWCQVEVELGKLVIVGDEKQSIYLFRGADLGAYQAIANRLTGGRADLVEHLPTNYRSRRELVCFVNAVGRHTMEMPRYAPIEPAPHALGGGRIEMILFPGLSAEDARRAEAETIADWVAVRCRERQLHPREVALLLRTLRQADHYTSALRRRGIAFVIDGEKQFHTAQEVVDFVNLLTVVSDPSDVVAVAGLLRSPLGAARDVDLVALHTAGALCALDPERVPAELAHVRRLYERLLVLHERSRRVPTASLVREMLEVFPLIELARAGPRADQAAANVRKLADQIAFGGAPTLRAALDECRRRFVEGEEEGEAALADDELDAVRVLCIHKAKGLEFPVVVLADLHREYPGTERPHVLREWLTGRVGLRCGSLCNRDWVVVQERHLVRKEEEIRRLLYVGLTRARDTLLLTGGDPDGGLLGHVVAALAAEGLELGDAPEQRLVGDGFEVTVRMARGAATHVEAAPAVPGPSCNLETERRDWERRARARERVVETPVLDHPSAAMAIGLDADEEPTAVVERAANESAARSIGSRCHAALAAMDLQRPELLSLDEEVADILAPFFRSDVFRALQAAERVEREIPFVIRLGDRVWSGQIDVLYRVDGRWKVADYKSDRTEAPERYRPQARVYAHAAHEALGLAELPEVELIYLRSGRVVSL